MEGSRFHPRQLGSKLEGRQAHLQECSRPPTRIPAPVASPFCLRSRHYWQPGAPLPLTTQAGGASTGSLNLKQQCHAPAASVLLTHANAAVISVRTPASRP